MRVHVDEELCLGDETCVELCPEVFEMDGDVARTKMENVDAQYEDACREAAENCPADAIIVEE